MTRPVQGTLRDLRAFQDEFASALLVASMPGNASSRLARLMAQPGFAVYRNTVLKSCIDALQLNYPAVARLVGEDRFRAAAAVYARSNPPRQPMLHDYGHDFAVFLARFDPAHDLPWLANVARLDRLWTESHLAQDEAPVAAASVACLAPANLAHLALLPHPAARWAWFDHHPVVTLWQRNRNSATPPIAAPEVPPEGGERGEGVLITRPLGHVEWTALHQSGCAFLDAFRRGSTLEGAAAAAMAVDPQVDLADLMAKTLAAGALIHPAAHARQPLEPLR